MKKTFIFLAIIVAAAILLVFMYLLMHRSTTPAPANGNPFGFASSTGTTDKQTLTLSDGSVVGVPDFLPKSQPEWASAVYGYQVTQDDTKPYSILYYPNDSSFLISLIAEPLGQSRAQAETALQNDLKLSKEQMCKVKTQVFTSVSVNESYAGHNLGLSYCPGATQLPF